MAALLVGLGGGWCCDADGRERACASSPASTWGTQLASQAGGTAVPVGALCFSNLCFHRPSRSTQSTSESSPEES